MRRTLSWILAALTFLTGLAVALKGFGTAMTSWAQTVPPGIQYDAGNRASVDEALLRTTAYWQQEMESHYLDPLLLTSLMLFVATTVLAIVLVRGWRAHGKRDAKRTA
ncbi:MAG: hypothetical protein AB8H80_03760 [Planctomycetota bacterium]